MTALSFGGAPGVAVLGGDLSQLRRRGGRWRLRDWRLRTKLTAVLLVPLVLAGVLGTLRVADSLREAARLDVLARQVGFARQVGIVVHDLQRERHLAVTAVLAPRTADPATLSAQQVRVDRGVSALRSVNSGARDLAPPAAQAYRTALDRLADLSTVRADLRSPLPGANSPAVTADKAVSGYTGLLTALLELNRAVLGGPDEPLADSGDALGALAVAKEQVSEQHAVLLAAMLSGVLSSAQQTALRTADARFDAALDEFGEGISTERKQRYDATVTGQSVGEWDRLLDNALSGATQNTPLEIVPDNWDLAATDTAERIRQVETGLLDQLISDISTAGKQAWNHAIRDAVVVALLMGLAVLLLVVVVRSLLRPLRTLRTHAFDVADRRLPDAVETLRDADDTIGETTVDPVPVYSREEVGQVARAFDTVHVQAVRLAAEQAMLRGTLNDIFLNLAGRSQHLVERQLKLIEKLESGEQDPAQLGNLFQLDHLATRMRRNSENLLVLAGGELRRGTERGVLVLDMLHAAVAEIAEYGRVTLRRPPAATVAGPVVTDLVHLIAELLDNATNSGPPDTTVTLASAITDEGGLLVEIVDCGTGLPPGELHAINERLASPPVVDVSVSRQMGLFVVSRLAARHRIRVRLRQQRGEFGITASVLLPSSLVRAVSPPPPDEAATDVPATDEPTAELPAGQPDHQVRSGTVWSSRHVDLPLQVSVVDGTTGRDLFSPSSIGNITVAHRRPRTTEEEWHELFGRDDHDDDHEDEPGGPVHSHPPAGREEPGNREDAERNLAPDPAVPAAGAADDFPLLPGEPESAAGPPPEVHEEIFEAVSAWFRDRHSEPADRPAQRVDVPVPGGDPDDMATPPTGVPSPLLTASAQATAPNWRSAGDDGWQAANALGSPGDFDVTAAGLPRRRPREQLIPGAARAGRPGPAPSPPPARTPDDVRGRLASYQRGLRHGRHALIGPEEQTVRSYPRQEYLEEG